MSIKMLEFKKIDNSICVVNHLGMSVEDQMYYAALMISNACEYEDIPKVERENDCPLITLSFDEEKKELNMYSSEDRKETIQILSSTILLKLISG